MNLKLIISTLIIFILTVYLSFVATNKLNELSSLTKKMYEYPINVLNATKNIKINLLSMHRYMKDVVLSKNEYNLNKAISRVDKDEREVFVSFEIIRKYYLGNQEDVQKLYNEFMYWRIIRNEISMLSKQGKNDKAYEITIHKGYKHVLLLERKVDILIEHANNQAQLFLLEAQTKKESTLNLIYSVAVFFIFLLILSVIITIRRIKSFEAKSLKSLNHFQTVLNTSVNAIIAIDNKLNILTFNKAAEKMFGFTFEEMQISNNLLSIVPDEYVELHKKALANFIKTEKSSGFIRQSMELTAKRKDTTIFPIKLALNYSGTKDNLIIVANIIDITLEKQKDKQLMQQSRLAQMGEMISMIAHQWRQPLGAISASSANLQVKIELDSFDLNTEAGQKEQSEYFSERLELIDEYVQNLTTTIDDFRNFYKPNKTIVKTTFKAIANKALGIIKASLNNDNIELIIDYDSEEEIEIYDNEMMQVILNIFKNAQDNFKEKKITSPQLKIFTHNKKLSITDNGGGIPKDILEKIFDPYFSTKTEKNGTGLGLYMSKIIVEEHHGGKLLAENTDDGVCFTIDT